MAESRNQESEGIEDVSRLLLDVTTISGTARLSSQDLMKLGTHDAQLRSIALMEFANSLDDAATRLRQQGLHPDAQGKLL